MTKHTRSARWLAALASCAMMVVAVPAAQASATTETPYVNTAETPAKAKLTAKLLDKKVKVNHKARVRGRLDLADTSARGLEPLVVQKLVAGVWIDVMTTNCLPNSTFRLSLSFSVAAQYSLRVYHPATTVVSATLSLTVIG